MCRGTACRAYWLVMKSLSESVLIVLIFVLVGMALAYFFNEVQTPFYRASIAVSFQSQTAGGVDPNLLRGRLFKHAETLQSVDFLQTVVASELVQAKAEGKAGMRGTWLDNLLYRSLPSGMDEAALIKRIQNNLSITTDPVGSLVVLSVLDPDPNFAFVVAQTVPEKYKIYLGTHSETLTLAVSKIREAIKKNAAGGSEDSDVAEQLRKIWVEQNSLKTKLEELAKVTRIAEKSIPSWITNQELSVINNQLIQKTLAYQKLSPRSPEARQLDLEMADLKKRFDAKLESVRAEISARVEELNQREAAALASLQVTITDLQTTTDDKTERELLAQILELKNLDPATHGEALTVTSSPTLFPRSAKPDKLFNLFVALTVSLGLSFLFITARVIFAKTSLVT